MRESRLQDACAGRMLGRHGVRSRDEMPGRDRLSLQFRLQRARCAWYVCADLKRSRAKERSLRSPKALLERRALDLQTLASLALVRSASLGLAALALLGAGCSNPANAEGASASQPLAIASREPERAAPTPPSAALSAAPLAPPPTRFLVIGDSYVFGKLGRTLESTLKLERADKPERKVWTYGSCGSSPLTWIVGIPTPCGVYVHEDGQDAKTTVAEASPTPHIQKLLSTLKPDVTIIVMGTNFLRCPQTTAPDTKKLVDEVERAGSLCVWVGPPAVIAKSATPVEREEARFSYERLYQALAVESRCKLIDTRKLGVPVEDKTDGYHAGPLTSAKLGVEVGRLVSAYVEEKLGR